MNCSRAARVLVVDDDATSRAIIQAFLTGQGVDVVLADCSAEARRKLSQNGPAHFEAVVTDHRMEGGDGLELLYWIREKDRTLATIMVTAESERELLADSLRGGASDFLEKPVNLGHLFSALAHAVESTRKQRQLKAAETAVEEISRVQKTLLAMQASALEDRLEVCFFPMQQAGGDFNAVVALGHRRFVILASDVSGHDVRAAFVASYFQGIFRGMLECGASVEAVFEFFNRFLVHDWNRPSIWGEHSGTETSMAACAVALDLEAGTIDVLDCGFPAPVHVGVDGTVTLITTGGASPLGWFAELGSTSRRFSGLAEGELLLWSDGVEDLAAALGVDVHALVHRLRRAVRTGEAGLDFLCGATDDVMALCVRLGAAPTHVLLHQVYAGDQYPRIDTFQALWRDSLALALPELAEDRRLDLLLCLREAVLNALLHGCGGAGEQTASCTVTYHPAGPTVRVRVSDPGPGHSFDCALHHLPAENEALVDDHRGLLLMQTLSDAFTSRRNGAELVMEFKTPSLSPHATFP